jgi:hypothetical protein
MPLDIALLKEFWLHLFWPLARLLFWVSLGIVLANFIEALNWTPRLARLTRPLARLGRLSAVSGASFSMAFFSGVTANTMLAEAFAQGRLARKELVLANLFSSLPRFFLHLPTVFFLTVPLIKGAAFQYVGLTFGAALLQTGLVVVAGRLLLPPLAAGQEADEPLLREKVGWREALQKGIARFKKRIGRIFSFLVPVYILFFFLNRYGAFAAIEQFLVARVWFLAWLDPQSLGIVMAHVGAEFSAGLAAAGALLADNSLGHREVVIALLVGNILSTPIRAVRHQFPYYVGIFPPKLALELVGISQLLRMASVVVVGLGYYFMTLG